MTCFIDIELPGLTRDVAIALDRAADLAGAPLTFAPARRGGWIRSPRPASVWMEDLREEPSIASETLDHPDGWPQDEHVREWLIRAVEFLAAHAPERSFAFRAGWGDNKRGEPVTLDVGSFVDRVGAGTLRADERYEVADVAR